MDFQHEYDSATDTINSVITNQLTATTSWTNVPGSLIKASSSDAGYVWGYNSNFTVFVCTLPCSGNWEAVDLTQYNIGSIQDLTTDSTNVYILMTTTDNKNMLLTSPAIPKGTWNAISVPFSASSIFSTNTYIWAQDASNNKQRCPKPCTSPNWLSSPENKITITSASSSSLYGKDGLGNAMKTDESLQSGWSQISGLTGLKLKSVVGQADQTALYGIDTASHAYRCDGDCSDPKEVDPLDTSGYMPLNVTADQKSLWMTATTPGQVGNIFTKFDKPDYTTIVNTIAPVDQQRDKIVDTVESEFKQQTNTMIAGKQINEVVNFFSKIFRMDSGTAKQQQAEAERYHKKVEETQGQLDQIDTTQPIIQILVYTLGAVFLLYWFGSFIGSLIHTLAFFVLAIGLGYAIYYSSKQ